jgi:hypothetical protein
MSALASNANWVLRIEVLATRPARKITPTLEALRILPLPNVGARTILRRDIAITPEIDIVIVEATTRPDHAGAASILIATFRAGYGIKRPTC